MKKIKVLVMMIAIVVSLTGCGNALIKKSMEQAKSEIESNDYDKALISLDVVLKNDKNNTEAQMIYDIINEYKELEKLVTENKFDEAKILLGTINEAYNNYPIKDDIKILEDKVNNYFQDIEKVETYLLEAERLLNEGKYDDCKSYLNSKILGLDAGNTEIGINSTENQKAKTKEMIEKCGVFIAELEARKQAEQTRVDEERGQEVSVGEENYSERLLNGVPYSEELKRVKASIEAMDKKVEENRKASEESLKSSNP